MRILLTNDDGINAPGIRAMQKQLAKDGHELILVAPDRERSAASHSLTLRKDLRVRQLAKNEFSVDGTPVDCIVVAFQHLVKEPTDLVISGINAGQNMGEDVFYSGTVAAALEASLHGHKAIAISINSYKNQLFDTAATWMARLLDDGIDSLCIQRGVLNINVPNLPLEQIHGVRLTRPGHRRYYNFIKILEEHDDGFSYQICGEEPTWVNYKGTDAEAISQGYISISPLGFELVDEDSFAGIDQWLHKSQLLELAGPAHAL